MSSTSKCPDCSRPFDDVHGHGVCFGCKIKGVSFASIRQGPSKWALEAEAIADIKAKGLEPERPDRNFVDKRHRPPQTKFLTEKTKREIHQRYANSGDRS